MFRMLNKFGLIPVKDIALSPHHFFENAQTRALSAWVKPAAWRPPVRQQIVMDQSVLATVKPSVPLQVMQMSELQSAGNKRSGGRSNGCKVKREMSDGTLEYYYYKLPYYRIGFVKELVVGALARKLFGELAPKIYAVEISDEKEKSQFQYGIISQSLGSNLHYDNLENWAFLFDEDEEEAKFGPRHFGKAIALKLLLGDSDMKLANFVLLRDQKGFCYPIDHEYAFDLLPYFIRDAGEAVKKLLDYKESDSSAHVPLQGNKKLLDKIFPLLGLAVERDVVDRSIFSLYERFASLPLSAFQEIYDQFGILIKEDDRNHLTKDLLARQDAAKKFIEQCRLEREEKRPGFIPGEM